MTPLPPTGQSTLMYERTLIIIGIVISVLVFIVICIASYFLAKSRRKRFEQRRRRREAKRAARRLETASQDHRVGAENASRDKHLPNDVGLKDSPLPFVAHAAAESATTISMNPYPAQHEIHPLLLKKQQEQQQLRQQQQVDDEPDPQLEALLRSCDTNFQPDAPERRDSRRRLVASSYDSCAGVPSTFKACVDRKETTTAALLHTPEDIELNNILSDGKDQPSNGHSNVRNEIEYEGSRSKTPPHWGVDNSIVSAMPNVSSPPSLPSLSSFPYSPRRLSSGSVSPPPYHSAVYIPSPSHHQSLDDESPEEEAVKLPLLASSQQISTESSAGLVENGPGYCRPIISGDNNSEAKHFQKQHAPPLYHVREWSSAPSPTNPTVRDSLTTILKPSLSPHTDEQDNERGYDSEDDVSTERDNLLGKALQPSAQVQPQDRKSKGLLLPANFPKALSVSHSNTFPKPSRVNGVIRGGSESHNTYSNSDDDSSTSDENDAPREYPYQKQQDDLYISEDDLGLSKENLVSASFSSGMAGAGLVSRKLSHQESREMEEPVVGLLPSHNLTAPRGADQLRKYPSEEGPAYSIMAVKAQGLHLQDCSRSKSLDDPLVSSANAEPSTNATASASSLSSSPYGSITIASSGPQHRNPHHHNYHYPWQQPHRATQPSFGEGSRLHSTLAGSPMVETYGDMDGRSQPLAPYRSRPVAYDPNEDSRPWDTEATSQLDRSRAFGREVVEQCDEKGAEDSDRLQRLKDVYPDQPAIPI